MLERHVLEDANRPSGEAKGPATSVALTAAQLGVWIDYSIDPSRTNYNISEYLEICGEIDLPVFRAALGRLVDEAETLHVRFVYEGDELRQVRVPITEWPFTFVDMTSDPAPRATAESWLEDYVAQPIDPLSGPLFAFALLKVASDKWFWCARYHHIVNDGFGVAMIARRFAQIYTAMMAGGGPGPSSFGTLGELLAEDGQYRGSDHFARDRAYWTERLAKCPEPVSLSQAQWQRSDRFTRRTAHLPFAKAEALRRLAKSFGLTLPQIITVAAAVYLHGMTGEDDIVVGYSVAGRLGALASRFISMLSNVEPLRFSIQSDTPFSELAQRASRSLREAMRRQRYRIADIRRDLGRIEHPLYGILVNVMSFDYDMTFAGCRVIAHNLANGPVSDLSIAIYDRLIGDDVRIDFDTNPLRYAPEETESHLNRFVALLSGLIEAEFERDPAKCVGALPLVTAQERQRLLSLWDQRGPVDQVKCTIHQMFEAQCERTPDAVAVSFGDRQISYQELNGWSNKVAHALLARGVSRDGLVGLCLDRGIELIAAMLGILKAGAGYLPIDISYPDDRLAFMLEDTAATVVISDATNASRLTAHASKIFWIDRPDLLEPFSPENPVAAGSPDDLAYVIYTSGSTGRPKGVLITHRNVVRLFLATERWFGFSTSDVWTMFHSPAFDFSVWEIWGALLYGGRLVIVPYLVSRSPAEFRGLLAREGVTVLNQTPTAFNQLVHADAEADDDLSLRYVIFGGEALEMRNLIPWFERHGDRRPQLVNMYGITETTVHVTCRPLGSADVAGGSVVGIPIPDLQVYILNANLQPLPPGVAGEMFVGGAGLARGYLNRPELTAERFVPDPFSNEPGRRLYRSGDGARILPTGEIEYLGRLDHQVKIRGFRIELGEIETALNQHPAVRDTAVVAREDVPGTKRLVAYLVKAAGAEEISREELGILLKRTLPDYMVPAAYVWLAALPLTHNGKLDRKALPAPDSEPAADATTYVAPRNAIEATFAGIWQDVLRLKRVGVRDKFFEIGGDSILSLLVISRANRAGLRITPSQIFQHQTIAALAAAAETIDRHVETQEPVHGPVPLTAIQSWFFEQDFADSQHWNQTVSVAVANGIEPELLERALQALVDHHDALRLRFHRSGTGWLAANLGVGERIMLSRIDLSREDAARQQDLAREAAVALNTGLDLSAGPLIRAAWVDFGAVAPRQLLIVIHHLAVDGVSWRILLEDLQSACHQLRRDEAVKLPAKTTSFKKWAERVQEYARSDAPRKEAQYWLRAPAWNSRALPRDFPNGDNTEESARAVSVMLDADDTDLLLHKAPQALRTQINDLLLTALGMALGKWMSTPHIQLDLEGHGRDLIADSSDLSRTVGWFTTIFPVRLDVDATDGLTVLLKSVKEQLRAIPNGGGAYGVLRYMAPDGSIRDGLRSVPRSEIVFNYLGQFDQALTPDVLTSLLSFAGSRSPKARPVHLLAVDAIVAKGRLRFDWTYNENIHRHETIAGLAQNYLECLRELIRHCTSGLLAGCTPSDFSDVDLSQDELDTLVAEVGDVANLDTIYSQSPTQQGMLFATLFAPESGTDIEQVIFGVQGNLQVSALRHAWEGALQRHDVLRTLFMASSLETPLQVVLRQVELPWEELDWRHGSVAQRAEWRKRFLEDDRRRGFAVAKAPLMRVTVVRLGDDQYEMIWTHHHILLDGWSVSLILKEVAADYSARCGGRAADIGRVPPYRQFIAWLLQQHSSEAEGVWRTALKGFTAPTRLGAAGVSNRVRATTTHRRTLSARSTAAINRFAGSRGLTVSTVVTAAWALLLSRASRQERVLFGASSSGRPTELEGVESMVGLFATSLPLPVHVRPQSSLSSWMRGLQDQLTTLRKHEHASLADIQDWGEVPTGEPMFESLVAFENYPLDESLDENVRWLGIDRAELVEQTNYPLVLTVVPAAEMVTILTYDVDRFDAEGVARLADSFEAIFPAMIATPDAPVSQLLDGIETADTEQEQARAAKSRSDRPNPPILAAVRDSSALSSVDGGTPGAGASHVEPGTNIEFTLVKIVARILGVEKLGVTDDFFKLGMSSITAVRIVNELNRTLNLKLGVAALFRYRTIEQLARGAIGWEQPVVVQLANGKSDPPIYVINAGAHQIQIARFLSDRRRPAFGIEVPLRSSWHDAAREGCKDAMPAMDDLVTPYLDALREHAGTSGCILVGHCFAGLVAFEVGRRYQEAGGKVDMVVLLDSPMPLRSFPVALRQWSRIWSSGPDGAGRVGARTKDSLGILHWLIKEIGRRGLRDMRRRFAPAVLAGLRDEDGRFVEVPVLERIYNLALETYVARRTNTPGLLVRAEAFTESERPYREYDPTLGWGNSFAVGPKILQAKGNHLSMIEDDENMAAIAREVNALLDAAAADTLIDIEVERKRLKAS